MHERQHAGGNICFTGHKVFRFLADLRVALRSKKKVRVPGRLLVVRPDAIGDYILFRGALAALRQAEAFRGCEIMLCGNARWEELACRLDSELFDSFLPADTVRMMKDSTYRNDLLKQIAALGAEVCLNPCFSRSYLSDLLVLASGARRRVGFASTPLNISAYVKQVTDYFYHERIATPQGYPFELELTDQFLNHLGVQGVEARFQANTRQRLAAFTLRENLRPLCGLPVLFLGGALADRRWPVQNFIRLARLLKDRLGSFPLFSGGLDIHKETAGAIPSDMADLCLIGKTSLIELWTLISRSPLVVSTDSFAAHAASACGVPTVILSNGQHAGRFHPYPAHVAPCTRTVYPPSLDFGEDAMCRLYFSSSPYDIADITVEAVMEAVKFLIPQNRNSA